MLLSFVFGSDLLYLIKNAILSVGDCGAYMLAMRSFELFVDVSSRILRSS